MKSGSGKRALLDELVKAVRADFEALHAAQRSAIEGATHEEAKPENDKDTRGLEQSYLARGQAMRLESMADELTMLEKVKLNDFTNADAIAMGALIAVEDDGATRSIFLLPAGAGKALRKNSVQVVTPASPFGQALLGKTAGDVIELKVAGKQREIEVISLV